MKTAAQLISIFATIFCLFTGASFAAEWATVRADKALVYADPQMSSPIGFFKKGQKLRVGENRKNKGRVIPTVYKKKVVYVRVADLQTARDLVLVRSASERVKDREKERERESRVGVSFNAFLASATNFQTVEEEQEFTDDAQGIFMGGFGLYGLTRKSAQRSALKMKIDYFSGSKDETNLSMLLLTGEYAREFVHFERFSLFGFAGVSLAPWAAYEVGSLFKVNGYGAGVGAGLEGLIRFTKTWALHVEGKYNYLQLLGFKLPESNDDTTIDEEFSPSISGPSVGAFVTYSF